MIILVLLVGFTVLLRVAVNAQLLLLAFAGLVRYRLSLLCLNISGNQGCTKQYHRQIYVNGYELEPVL